jgi:acetyl esterase/lipase
MPHFFLKSLTGISVVMLMLTLTACSGIKVLNFITPSNDYTLYKDISYQPTNDKKLDVYVPAMQDTHHNVVIFFYGGSWQSGSKDMYRFVGQSLAKQGYVTIIADYRTYPDSYFPAFMEDAAQVLKWTHTYAAKYGGNNKRIFVAGHSAGAHIAMLLTLDQSYLRSIEAKPSWIHGTIGIAGPYDFLPFTDPKIKALFSKSPDEKSQPINYVHKNVAPILLLHGTADKDVYLKNSVTLERKLHKNDNQVRLITYDNIDHIDIIMAMSIYFHYKAPVLNDIKDFIDAQ